MRNYKKRDFKSDELRSLTKIQDRVDASQPVSDKVVKESNTLFSKTLKGLPKSGSSLSVKADPYALTLPDSDPYALLNSQNAKAGGSYGGEDNLDGGVTNQLASSEVSTFLHSFDTMMVRCKTNYRYLPIKSTDVNRGKGFVREMIHAIDEVISIAKSTTYTQLGINQYYIKTDLPIARADGSFTSDRDQELSCGKAEGLYALLVCYQTYLQSFASCFNAYNKFRANQGCMMNMSWNRETPRLNSYFSLMNKNSMVGQFNSLAFVLNGEYFDAEWMRQFNMIASLTSRKSNAIVDPLKEVICTHNLPYFKLYIKSRVVSGGQEVVTDTVVFESTTLDTIIQNSLNDNLANLTFEQASDYIAKVLSINDTLYWVRNNDAYISLSEQSRFNLVSDYLSALVIAAGVFKPAMGDLRTMLDVVQRVGANAWSKSTKLEIFSNLKSPVLNNLTVDDLYSSLMSGSTQVTWDEDTFRWVTSTLWNYYYGIPEYDSKSGGSFLTFSTKTVTSPGNYPAAADYLPVFISGLLTDQVSSRGGKVYAVNRLGTSVELGAAEFDPAINPSSARLVPLIGMSMKIRIPYSLDSLNAVDMSHLQAACLKAFGSFSYGNSSTITATTDLAVNPDYLCLITVEVNDLSNEMITYARSKGPFVVNFDERSKIGFLGLA